MAGQFILGFFAAIALGVVLLVLGLRGRRLNRRPTCRSCRFDLSGTLPDGVTCPECGAGLKRERAVRIGQRKRMWVVAAIGGALIVLPTGAIATTVYAVLTGADINQFKPLGVLLWEARHTGAAQSQAIAKELLRRQSNKLDETRALRVVETALDIQADTDSPWCEEWGDFIELSRLDGVVTDELYTRFMQQAVGIECEGRPRVGPGAPLPVLIRHISSRVGSGTTFNILGTLGAVQLDGESIPSEAAYSIGYMMMGTPSGEPSYAEDAMVLQGIVAGGASRWGRGSTLGNTVLLRLPDTIRPGPHELELTVRVQAAEMQMNSTFTWRGPDEDPDSVARTVRVPFEVAAAASQIEVIEPTDELTQQIQAALTPAQGWVWDGGMMAGRQLQVSMSPSGLPCDLAFEAFLVRGNKQLKLGPARYHVDTTSSMTAGAGWGRDSIDLSVDPGEQSLSGAHLVLRPRPELALRTTDVTKVYGGEIVITELEIRDQDGKSLTAADSSETETAPEEEISERDRQIDDSGRAFGRWLRSVLSGG